MKFGPIRVEDAEGAILAHSVTAGGRTWRKATLLGAEDVAALAAAGLGEVVAAMREPGDLDENEAATLVAATLYGLPGGHPDARPVMRLSGRVLSTKRLRAGEGVSYGYAHRAAADTRVALVTGGYAQGVVRMLGDRVQVRVGGAFRPLIGRIAMDVCVVDIAEHDVARGDEVVFFGDPREPAPPLSSWTAATGWTAGELVSLVGARAHREVGA